MNTDTGLVQRALTPKQVARAIGVSESSLKRWCDRGLLPFTKTAGGHRRLSFDTVVEFVRRERYRLVEPEVLGLPASTGSGNLAIERAREQLLRGLIAGDEVACTRVVFDLYLASVSLVTICDDVIAQAFQAVGDQWACNQVDIYQERRACDIFLRVLQHLSLAQTAPPTAAPLAIGCTPPGDHYALPTRMIEMVLQEQGWRATSLGSSIPFPSMIQAIHDLRPQVFWLSVSYLADEAQFAAEYRSFFEAVATQTCVVLGGRQLQHGLGPQLPCFYYGPNLASLVAHLPRLSKLS